MCQTPFLPQDFKKGCSQHTACFSNTQSLASRFLIYPSIFFLEVTSLRKSYLINWSEPSPTCTQIIMHFFPSSYLLGLWLNHQKWQVFFFFLIILFHVCFSTRCKLSERGAQSCSPRCPQSSHCLNPTGLEKHSWSRGTPALLHECLHFRRWAIICLKLKPETQRSSLIPSPSACHVANQSPNLTHSVYELPLQSGSLSLHFLLIQATVFNNSHNCSHVLGDVPSLKLSPSNPLTPHQTKEWPLESWNLITSLWWLCPPLPLDETKLHFCLLALPNLSPATCPDLSVHHPSWHFLGSLNLTWFLFHLLKCLLLSLTQMLLPQEASSNPQTTCAASFTQHHNSRPSPATHTF